MLLPKMECPGRNGTRCSATYAGTAAAVRTGKGLMQVKVADVCTDSARIGQTYLCIHVGAIHIYLCTALMNNFTYLSYFGFKDSVGGRISNHQCCQLIFVFFCFGTQVFYVYITFVIAGTSDGSVTALYSRCRIGSVSRSGNQYFVAVSLTDAFQICADDTQTGVFACCTRVWLESDSCKSGDDFQLFAQVIDECLISFCLVFRY